MYTTVYFFKPSHQLATPLRPELLRSPDPGHWSLLGLTCWSAYTNTAVLPILQRVQNRVNAVELIRSELDSFMFGGFGRMFWWLVKVDRSIVLFGEELWKGSAKRGGVEGAGAHWVVRERLTRGGSLSEMGGWQEREGRWWTRGCSRAAKRRQESPPHRAWETSELEGSQPVKPQEGKDETALMTPSSTTRLLLHPPPLRYCNR